MVEGATLSEDLSDADWLEALRSIGMEHGSYSDLGTDFSALFVEQSQRVLFVAFETILGIRAISDTGMPVAFDLCERRNWSHLTVISKTQTWFRDERVFNFFDELSDKGLFDMYDRVIFYGAGMCGYAAGAFSVAAPGATVLMVAPQATLDRDLAHWDDRFPSTRRLDFKSRYGYAPDMIEAAAQAVVIYDPDEVEDSMHASLFRGSNVILHRYRRGSAGSIEADFRTTALIAHMAQRAADGELTQVEIAKLMRIRRRHVPYLRALLSRVQDEDRPEMTARLCRSVLADQPLPRFRKVLDQTEALLAKRQATRGLPEDEPEDTLKPSARDLPET